MCQKYFERKGCILGDDMGMGKTVQIVSFLNCIFHKKGTYEDVKMIKYRHLLSAFALPAPPDEKKEQERTLQRMQQEKERYGASCRVCPVLIVVPPAVLYNWKREIDVWGCFDVGILGGEKGDKSSAAATGWVSKKRSRSEIVRSAKRNELVRRLCGVVCVQQLCVCENCVCENCVFAHHSYF